jgi:vancomycin resistance protein YoaR
MRPPAKLELAMKKINKYFIWSLLGLISIISIYLVVVLSFWFLSKDKVYPGVSVAGVSLSGKTRKEAEEIINEKIGKWNQEKFALSSEKSVMVMPSDMGIEFNISKTIDDALFLGAKNPFLLGFKRDIGVSVNIDSQKTAVKIGGVAKEINTQVVNSRVEKKDGQITVANGTAGKRVNYAESARNIKENAEKLGKSAKISVFSVPPTFTDVDLTDKMDEINEKSKNGLTLLDGSAKYPVSSEAIVSWVELAQPKVVLGKRMEGNEFFAPIFITGNDNSIFAPSLVSDYLLDLSGKINRNPVNAQLSISGERATIFVPSRDGRTLNIETSATGVIAALESKTVEAKLTVDITKPEIHEGSLNDMGILELLSTGYSNFAGSPTNRRHNIKVGASKFNGVLIKPDQEFSFNTTLGPVDASTGYLPELVIKENKTIPEYGGGMCQVSSTAFRAALNGGLPILERSPHSYPVSYYKPFGVDATVYLPHPDLVFKNDTGKYILVQTRISGNNLYFDFYGTKPQRTIKFDGLESAATAVFPVEKVNPYLYDQGVGGNNSFTAVVYRFIYDSAGKLIKTNKFVSKYDSPDNYPH